MPTITLNPSENAHIISHNPFGVYDSQLTGHVGDGSSSNSATRMLLKFDIATTIPDGAIIDDAYLELFESANMRTGEVAINTWTTDVHRVLEAWVSYAACWNKRRADKSWVTPGCTFVAQPSSSLDFEYGPANAYVRWSNLREDVQTWVDGFEENNGWLLRAPALEHLGTTQSQYQVFYSNVASVNPPRLVITYHMPTEPDGDKHPVKAWCESGISAGDAILIPTFGARGVSAGVWDKNKQKYVPAAVMKDAIIYLADADRTSYQLDTSKTVVFGNPGAVDNNWSFMEDAVINGPVVNGQFVLVKFIARGETEANGVTLKVKPGLTYDLAAFLNSDTELLYLFHDGVLVQTEQNGVAQARTTLTFTGNPTIRRAKAAGAKHRRIVHWPFKQTKMPPDQAIVGYGAGQNAILPSRHEPGVVYYTDVLDRLTTVRDCVYRVTDNGIGTITRVSTPFSERITLLWESDSGHLFVGCRTKLYRSTTPAPFSEFTLVLDATVGAFSTFMSNITQTRGGRIWACPYESKSVGPFYSDDDGLTWTSLGSSDNIWPENITHLHNIFYDRRYGSLHVDCGDNLRNIEVPRVVANPSAVLYDADMPNPKTSDFILVMEAEPDIKRNGGFRPVSTRLGNVLFGVDRSPSILSSANRRDDGTWVIEKIQQLGGDYRPLYVAADKTIGGVTVISDVGIPPDETVDGNTGGQEVGAGPVLILKSQDDITFPVVFEGKRPDDPWFNSKNPQYPAKGSRYSFLPWLVRDTAQVDLGAFIWSGTVLEFELNGSNVELKWDRAADGQHRLYRSNDPSVPEMDENLVYIGSDKSHVDFGGVGNYYRLVTDGVSSNVVATRLPDATSGRAKRIIHKLDVL